MINLFKHFYKQTNLFKFTIFLFMVFITEFCFLEILGQLGVVNYGCNYVKELLLFTLSYSHSGTLFFEFARGVKLFFGSLAFVFFDFATLECIFSFIPKMIAEVLFGWSIPTQDKEEKSGN